MEYQNKTMMKIYIHHPYQKFIFYKLAHNTTNREYFIENSKGSVLCKYKNINIEFIFKQEISFEEDGYHILDYFTAFLYGESDSKIGKIKSEYWSETQKILKIFINLLKDCPKNQKWLITCFRTEKILSTKDTNINDKNCLEIELLIDELKAHHFITDNMFLSKTMELQYPNFYYTLTNTIFQWNEILAIRWFYEFKKIYDKLSFDYDLMYSIRNHKQNRVSIIIELEKLKNKKLLLQRSDSLQNDDYKLLAPSILHIKTNSIYGDIDFSDITWIMNHKEYMDMFFRVLPKAKMQILCESWSWSNTEFTTQYLSEKTFGLILAGIPFISTHNYPLQIVQKMLDVPPHPFYDESKKCRANGKLFAQFVDTFLQNFDENYKLCKDWSDLVHNKLIYKMENVNSLLDLIIEGGLKTEFVVKKSLI
jgi:hypothetical protein